MKKAMICYIATLLIMGLVMPAYSTSWPTNMGTSGGTSVSTGTPFGYVGRPDPLWEQQRRERIEYLGIPLGQENNPYWNPELQEERLLQWQLRVWGGGTQWVSPKQKTPEPQPNPQPPDDQGIGLLKLPNLNLLKQIYEARQKGEDLYVEGYYSPPHDLKTWDDYVQWRKDMLKATRQTNQ